MTATRNQNSSSTDLDDGDADALTQAVAGTKAKVKVVKGKNDDPGLSGSRVTLSISEGSDPETGGDAIPIGINGFTYLIPRGERVDVPVEVLEVLNNAMETRYPTKQGIVQGARQVMRYPYQLHSQPTPMTNKKVIAEKKAAEKAAADAAAEAAGE